MSMDRMQLLAPTTQTTSGNTPAFEVQTLTMAQLELVISAASGTIALDIWLEVSSNGTDWFEMPADLALKSNAAAASDTVRTNVRDIVDNKTTLALENFLAIYKHLPAGFVRLRWTLTGSTPSVTFAAALAGK